MVLWICGLSGSGKTTLGSSLYRKLKPNLPNLFLLDGDDFREAVGDSLGYSSQQREQNAHRIARFCHLLDSQDIHVICCAVTLPEEVQIRNRTYCRDYMEVYLKVSLETLIRRDPKSLYKRCLSGAIKNVPGVDIEYIPPQNPHVTLDNNSEKSSLDDMVWELMNLAVFPQNIGRVLG